MFYGRNLILSNYSSEGDSSTLAGHPSSNHEYKFYNEIMKMKWKEDFEQLKVYVFYEDFGSDNNTQNSTKNSEPNQHSNLETQLDTILNIFINSEARTKFSE